MSIPFRLDELRVREGMDFLARLDPRFAEARAQYGDPPLRTMDEGFAALVRSIVGQQVSVFAARSIWDRLAVAVDPVTPDNLLRLADAELRACGLSNNKVRFARALALDTVARRIVFEALHALDDEAVVATLTQAKGIGRWTAEIYMMFALGRPDVMPANDLGLMVAAQHLLKLRRRPEPQRLLKLSAPWRPWRSVASLFLWHVRRNMPDFSSSPAAQARRAAEQAAKDARKAARLAKAVSRPAAREPATAVQTAATATASPTPATRRAAAPRTVKKATVATARPKAATTRAAAARTGKTAATRTVKKAAATRRAATSAVSTITAARRDAAPSVDGTTGIDRHAARARTIAASRRKRLKRAAPARGAASKRPARHPDPS